MIFWVLEAILIDLSPKTASMLGLTFYLPVELAELVLQYATSRRNHD